MDRNNRYPLRIEGLRKDITTANVRQFFRWPSADILENVEIISHRSTTTAYAILSRPDVAYEFLNAKDPEIDGCRVTLKPEFFEEMTITLNGSWLKEIEDEGPAIQVDIRKIASTFNLKVVPYKSVYGDTETISLVGVPWRVEQAREELNHKIQDIIMSRSRNVKRKWNENPLRSDVAGIRSSGDGKSVLLEIDNDMQPRNEPRNPDPQSYVDHKSSVENKGSSDHTNPGKKRERTLKGNDSKDKISEGAASISTDDDKTGQPKVGKRNRVLKTSKTGDMQKSESPVDTSGKSSPIHYPSSTQYQRVIRVGMDKHRYLVEHSTRLNFTDGSISQHQISEEEIDWVIGDNNEKDLRRNEEEMKRLIDKLLIKCYTAPTEFDFDIFKNLIEAENKNEDVTLIFEKKKRICKVVGPQNDVERTYKWIGDISGELAKGRQKLPGRGSASDTRDNSRSSGTGSSTRHFNTQQSGYQRYPQDYGSHDADIGNSQGRLPDPKVTKYDDGIRISKSSSTDRLEFKTRGNLRVSVYQGNMIKQATEVIVNPANDCLGHGGGLARVILDAAGQVLDDESRQIISKQGKLKTSEVVHTSAGKLPPPIKYVVHAVGPTAHEFKDNKAGLVPTLKVTFRNCLDYANDKLGVSSISLPPISSGIFAVPIPDIIRGAVEAIQDFDRKNSSGSVLKEVHFISNDAKTTEEMISCFRNLIG